MKKIFLTLLSSYCFFLAGFGQGYQKTASGIKVNLPSMEVELQFYAPDILRVIKTPAGTSFDKQSLTVIKTPETVPVTVSEKGQEIILESSKIKASLHTQTGKILFTDPAGKKLITDKENGTSFTSVKDGDKDAYRIRQAFLLDKKEAIYGLGQQQEGKMSQRNQTVNLRQENMRICIPFIQSEKGYGLFWDNYSVSTFEDTPDEMAFESTGLCADYYFIYGGNADGVIAGMRTLTGQAPMFPLWTFGFWQSRERYTSQDELVNTVKEYRRLGIPLDGIIQDWQYWSTDNTYWNSTEFGNPLFPEPKKMIEQVHDLNAHIIISVWPSFGPKTGIFQEFKDKNMLFDFETFPHDAYGARVYDAFNPAARDIYWRRLNQNMFAIGMDGWWLDATEPEHQDIKEADFDQPTYLGTMRSYYNAFPLVSIGGVYDHQRAVTEEKRVFILTRSAFAGQQRYAANSWSGDVDATFEVLRKQIPAGLNFSLCGIPYWNTDIGGFFVRDYDGGLKNKAYHELYVRWMQFATFTPMMRSHGTSLPREIYQFGQRGDWAFDVQEKYIHLRYSLLPYMYATGWEITSKSGTFMRALFMDFNEDKNVQHIDNQYMFGRSLLVAPVTEAMYTDNIGENSVPDFSRVKTQAVYLPKGTDWYDFWTNRKVKGGQTVHRETPVDIIPVYVKAGSILPLLSSPVQYATEKKWDELTIYIYPGANASFTLYEDENDTYNYEKGIYSVMDMNWNDTRKELSFSDRSGSFPGMLKERTFKVVLIQPEKENITRSVSYHGNQINITF